MDLPKCPSCGQSVLDDDAQDCPFCGAAMDGSSKKKPSAAPASGKAKPASAAGGQPAGKPGAKAASGGGKPEKDDPFAIERTPATTSEIPCARRPIKGRTQAVVCPMCETKGFIPRAALGRQVKCANPDCMVPIFTATAGDGSTAPAPARVSDESAAPSKTKKPASESATNPLLIYGIIGAVLLALTVGLVMYLNKPGLQKLGPADLPPMAFDDDEPEAVTPKQDVPEEKPATDHAKQVADIAQLMIQAARVTSGNRDKAYCRLLIGDVFSRAGMEEQAAAEFGQMKVVSDQKGRDTQYYRIAPLIRTYWAQLRATDAAGAAATLEEAKTLAAEIPETGLQAIEAGVAVTAALADSGDIPGAAAQIAKLQRDQSVASQMDMVRLGAWLTTSAALRDRRQAVIPATEVFGWQEPLLTAVGVQLAAAERWDTAVKWAAAQTGLTASDTFAAVAAGMVAGKAPENAQADLLTAAASAGAMVQFRTRSVLARNAAFPAWSDVAAGIQNAAASAISEMPNVNTVVDSRTPETEVSRLTAEALADAVIAAVIRKDTAAATTALQHLTSQMLSVVPPTALVRQAANAVETDEDGVEKMVAEQLNISDSGQIKSKFIAYRRGIDRLSRAAEDRRLQLILMLCRIVCHGGADTLKAALAADGSPLNQEVRCDELSGLLTVAGSLADADLSEFAAPSPELAVPLAGRSEELPELKAVGPIVSAWQNYLTSGDAQAVTALESVTVMAGLRTAIAASLFEKSAATAKSALKQMQDIAVLKNELMREYALEAACRILARRGLPADIITTLEGSISTTPTQRISALHGAALGVLDLQASEQK
ncbi:MAG: zinc ribbon domain-containing protein [Planctomycetaceae bacterium]|nr:zinc ribbon domain-containing protein [Planctomycetaceae bacterium]